MDIVEIPRTIESAMQDPKWKGCPVTRNECLNLKWSWEMVEIPRGKQTVGCKSVFNVKHKVDGILVRYKAKLLVQGLHKLLA